MTYAPNSLRDLAALWTSKGGVNLGIVGDAAHTWGYHAGRDRIFTIPPGRGWNDVSVKLARDRAGLTDAASALDLGHDDKAELRRFTGWLIERAQDEAPGTRDLREIIGSLDGVNTIYWDRERRVLVTNAAGVDSSHLYHTHLSWYRDSESRSKVEVFAPYWSGTGGDMGIRIKLLGTTDATPLDAFGTAKVGSASIVFWNVATGATLSLASGTDLGTVQLGVAVGPMGGYPPGTELVALNIGSPAEQYVTARAAVIFTPLPSPVVDCSAAVAAAVAPLNDQIAELRVALDAAPAKERDRIAEAEADRLRNV